MPNPFFSGRIPQALFDRIEEHLKTTSETKTQLLVNALSAYVGMPLSNDNRSITEPLEDRLVKIEKRLQALEGSVIGNYQSDNREENFLETNGGEGVITTDNEIDNDSEPVENKTLLSLLGEESDKGWLTTREAHEVYGGSLSYESFRKLSPDQLKTRFNLEADVTRRGKGKQKGQWLHALW
jgi:hypothetical protein